MDECIEESGPGRLDLSWQMLDEMMDLQKLEKSDESKRKSDPKRLVKAKLAETKAGCGRVRQGPLKKDVTCVGI